MGVVQRIRDLNFKLLNVRLGPGAAVLSRDVRSVHLEFAFKSSDGHLGPRKFWRGYLPRLKYHNPSIPMTIQRNTNQAGPAIMKIVFSKDNRRPSGTVNKAMTAEIDENERIETIDMKYKDESEILTEFLKITEAKQVSATDEEQQQLQESAQQLTEMEQDKKRSRLDLQSKIQEKLLLQQARQGAGGISQ